MVNTETVTREPEHVHPRAMASDDVGLVLLGPAGWDLHLLRIAVVDDPSGVARRVRADDVEA